MNSDQERCIIKNIVRLVKLTRNVPRLVDELEQATTLTYNEGQRILNCSDEESSCNLLYEIVMRKPYSFNILLTCLKNSDNGRLAIILESGMDPGAQNSQQKRIRRQSSSERYLKDDSSTTRSEMGIAELLEEYQEIRNNWTKLYHRLNLSRSEKSLEHYNTFSNIIVRFTLMLRDWVETHKKTATLDNLCKILDSEGHDRCSGRIRKMFERYANSGFEMDIAGGCSILGKETQVASILEHNPSFSVYPERLFLMLNGPIDVLAEIQEERKFMKVATRMLTEWASSNEDRATLENLAALVALNGHFYTADKLAFT